MTPWLIVPEDMLSLVAQHYNRTVPSLLEDVATLKNWMKTQPHLPEILDDKHLQNFLTLNKCSVERAKQRIDMYYTLRSKIPEIYTQMNPQSVAFQETEKLACWVALPKVTPELYRVWIMKGVDLKRIEEMKPFVIMAQVWVLQEMRLQEDIMFGEVIIIDFKGLTLALMSKFTLPVVTKMFMIYEKVLSFPMKQFYLVNSPGYIGSFLTILKTVIKPKIFNRIKVCQDTSILRKVLPRQCLPKDYGGDEKSVEELFELEKMKMREYQKRCDQLLGMKVDEGLRPEKLENDEVLGFHGNFKKLDVD